MQLNDIQPPDDDLSSFVADLEAMYDAPAPAGLAARIDAAIQRASGPVRREAQPMAVLRGRAAPPARREAGITQPREHRRRRGWWSGLAATAAMFAVVVLLAGMLHGGSGEAPGGSLPKHFTQVGGLRIVATTAPCYPPPAVSCDLSPVFAQESSVLEHRFATGLNAHDISIHQDNNSQLTIDLGGVTDQAAARALLAQGQFAAIGTGESAITVGFDVRSIYVLYFQAFAGEQIDGSTVQVELDKASGKPVVAFALRGQARAQYAEFTRTHVGQYLTFTLDGIVLESAVIQAPIATGSIQISGLPSMAAAQRLALFLRSGALPMPLEVQSITPVVYSLCGTPTESPAPTFTGTTTPIEPPTPTQPSAAPTVTAVSGATPTPNDSAEGSTTLFSPPDSIPVSCPTLTPGASGDPTATAIPVQATDTAPPSVTPPPETATPSPTATAIPPRPTATPS